MIKTFRRKVGVGNALGICLLASITLWLLSVPFWLAMLPFAVPAVGMGLVFLILWLYERKESE